jgi:hypothetical protein
MASAARGRCSASKPRRLSATLGGSPHASRCCVARRGSTGLQRRRRRRPRPRAPAWPGAACPCCGGGTGEWLSSTRLRRAEQHASKWMGVKGRWMQPAQGARCASAGNAAAAFCWGRLAAAACWACYVPGWLACQLGCLLCGRLRQHLLAAGAHERRQAQAVARGRLRRQGASESFARPRPRL